MLIYLSLKVKINILIIQNIIIQVKYLDFFNFFIKKLVAQLSKKTNINNYTMNLKIDKQLPYKSIYSLILVELKTLKIYIMINLVNSFTYFSNSSINIPIFLSKT